MSQSCSTEERLSIPEWSESDRPREKFANKGAAALSDAELVAILLRTGNATESAVDLSKRLLKECHNQLNVLADLSIDQLTKIKGIGSVKAITLQVAFEIGRRVRMEKVMDGLYIRTSADAYEAIQSKIAYLKHEEFWTIYLNQSSKILRMEQIGKGGLTNTVADVRVILQKAITYESTAMIVCHNHPSGTLQPSPEDLRLTDQLRHTSNIFNIKLLDHIIVHKERYYSLQEHDML